MTSPVKPVMSCINICGSGMQSVYHPFFTLSFSGGRQSELICKTGMKQPALQTL